MGILKSIFGSSGEKVTPSENKAERSARDDYIKEARDTGGNDPVPKEAPDWAKDLGPSGK
ncbi:hypothetical protein KKH36_02725 [Patescibacteria group bacterium]|nr:hypothetical protein [Patescibacteria group bacterium]